MLPRIWPFFLTKLSIFHQSLLPRYVSGSWLLLVAFMKEKTIRSVNIIICSDVVLKGLYILISNLILRQKYFNCHIYAIFLTMNPTGSHLLYLFKYKDTDLLKNNSIFPLNIFFSTCNIFLFFIKILILAIIFFSG